MKTIVNQGFNTMNRLYPFRVAKKGGGHNHLLIN
jgi:hypothetical protein